MLFAALYALYREVVVLRFGNDLFHLVLAVQLKLFVVLSEETGGETCPVFAAEYGVEQPILLTHEVVYLLFTVNDHSRCDRLHSACGKSTLYLLPKQRRELVAHDAVKQTACLLCIHEVLIYVSRMLDALRDDLFRDLVEGHSSCTLVVKRKKLL